MLRPAYRVERDSLAQIFHAFVFCQYFDAHVTDFNIFFVRIHGALVAENLSLVWVVLESLFLGCFLEFVHHVPQLFFGGCEQHHVVCKSQVSEAVSSLVSQVNSYSFFFFCHRCISSFNEYCSTVLNSRLNIGSPCMELFWMSKMSLSSSVCNEAFWSQEADVFVIDVTRFECLPNGIVRDGVESLREVDRRCPHFDSHSWHFCSNNLFVAKWSVDW